MQTAVASPAPSTEEPRAPFGPVGHPHAGDAGALDGGGRPDVGAGGQRRLLVERQRRRSAAARSRLTAAFAAAAGVGGRGRGRACAGCGSSGGLPLPDSGPGRAPRGARPPPRDRGPPPADRPEHHRDGADGGEADQRDRDRGGAVESPAARARMPPAAASAIKAAPASFTARASHTPACRRAPARARLTLSRGGGTLVRVSARARRVAGWGLALLALANAAVVVSLWLAAGGPADVHDPRARSPPPGRVAGLLGAYLVLVELLLLARIPLLERLYGFERLAVAHRVNGRVAISAAARPRRADHRRLHDRRPDQPAGRGRAADHGLSGRDHRDRRPGAAGRRRRSRPRSRSGGGCATRRGTSCTSTRTSASRSRSATSSRPAPTSSPARPPARTGTALYVVTLGALVIVPARCCRPRAACSCTACASSASSRRRPASCRWRSAASGCTGCARRPGSSSPGAS